MNIIIAILIFGIIIIVHELGHFLIAKKNGIQVDEFCIGLGPTIIGKQVGETFYSVKLLPFGGACMMGEDEDRPEENAFNNCSNLNKIYIPKMRLIISPSGQGWQLFLEDHFLTLS